MGRHVHQSSFTNLNWILNGYAVVYAALLIPLGRLAGRYGRKAGFLLGLGVFTAAGPVLGGVLVRSGGDPRKRPAPTVDPKVWGRDPHGPPADRSAHRWTAADAPGRSPVC